MYNRLQELRARREDGEAGFTLIELLVVVVIIGILVAIAIPLYLHFENGAKTSSAKADVHNLVAVVQQCASENNGTIPSGPATVAAVAGGTTFSFTGGTGWSCDAQGTLGPNNGLAYTASGGDYTITVTNSQSSHGATYTSSTGQTVEN